MPMNRAMAPMLPVLWAVIALHSSAKADAGRIRVLRYEWRSEVLDNADVKTTEKIIVARMPSQFAFARQLPLLRHDQNGNHWTIRYSAFKVLVDDRRVEFSRSSDQGRLVLQIDHLPEEPPSEAHTIVIEYLSSNAIRKRDGLDLFDQVIGGDWQIEKLDVFITLPVKVPSSDVQLTAFTEVTSSTVKCDCVITRDVNQIAIHTTRSLQAGESLSFSLSFKSGYLKREIFQNLEDFRQNSPNAVGWLVFFVSLLAYYVVTLAMTGLLRRKPAFILQSYSQQSLISMSVAMSALSLATLAVLQRPEVAMPGVFGGILVSMAVSGTAHGPSQRYLWIFFALIINAGFYFALFRIARIVVDKMRAGERGR
jgi:hypothetical protein